MSLKKYLREYCPLLSLGEINFIINYLNNKNINGDLLDLPSLAKDTDYFLLQSYLYNQYGIELPDYSRPTVKPSSVRHVPLKTCSFDWSKLFNKPCVIGVVGDTNTGKSNLLYWVIDSLKRNHNFKLFSFGLRFRVKGCIEIYSVSELENLRSSIIIVDEMMTLFDLDNRKSKRAIENTLRLVFHNNNILILCGLAENFKKFLSAKLHAIMFKQTQLPDLINGSRVKEIIMSYSGLERGSTVLNLDIDKAILWDGEERINPGQRWHRLTVPYLSRFDSKKRNQSILIKKK